MGFSRWFFTWHSYSFESLPFVDYCQMFFFWNFGGRWSVLPDLWRWSSLEYYRWMHLAVGCSPLLVCFGMDHHIISLSLMSVYVVWCSELWLYDFIIRAFTVALFLWLLRSNIEFVNTMFKLVILVCLLKIFGLVYCWVTYVCCTKNLCSRLMNLGDLFCGDVCWVWGLVCLLTISSLIAGLLGISVDVLRCFG